MFKSLKKKLKDSATFRLRFLVITFATVLLIPYSVSYAAFRENLRGHGEIDVLVYTSELVITNISGPITYKNVNEISKPSYENNKTDFSIELVNTNSTATYEITVKNNGVSNIRYDKTNIESNNAAFKYVLENIDKSTILEPGEETTFRIKVRYTEEYKYNFPNSKVDTPTIEFIFQPTLRDKLIPLTGYIVEDEGDVSETTLGAPITVHLTNPNDFPVSFRLKNANNFIVTNSEGIEKEFSLGANSSRTYNLFIKDSRIAVAVGTNAEIFVVASMTDYDVTQDVLVDSITLSLPNKGRFQLLTGGYSETPSDVDYTTPATSGGGAYLEKGLDGKNTYYYRGAVSNNYFSFANRLWRILRVDENANLRLISDDLLIDSSGNVITSQFQSTNVAYTLEDSYNLVRLVNDPSSTTLNSPIYGFKTDKSERTLTGWYNNTLANTEYEKYVVESTYCQDIEGGTATSSGTASSVYYFGPYQKTGRDTGLDEPMFDCPKENRINDKIGLLNVDEYVYAGGAFRVNNSSFFLNDSGISYSWWTMSPGYFDESQSKVGVFYVDATGAPSDWPNEITTLNSFGIRPVITVSGDFQLYGTGDKTDPYHF